MRKEKMDTEKSRQEVLSENINGYLSKNGVTQKEAAVLSGVKYSTLNSWIKMKAYPRGTTLQPLADYLQVHIRDLTEDRSESGIRRRYLSIAEIEILRAYEEDHDFRLYIDNGLQARREQSLSDYNHLYQEHRSQKQQKQNS